MTCSCEFSLWFKQWAMSFGTEMPFVLLGFILLVWGSRKVRREHFTQLNWRVALLTNYPAILFLFLGTVVLLATLIMSLL